MINEYLKRIGIDSDIRKPDFELLKKLQYAHVTSVPYENLDILRGIPLNYNIESLYDKIVKKRRGGYCFELNCLFDKLLINLGYSTKSHFARYLRGENEIPIRRHRILTVESPFTDGRYICDVGVGDRAPRYPLKLEQGSVQEQFGEIYKIQKDDFLGWVIMEFRKGEWNKYFAFTEEPQLDKDYITTSYYCENHPDSVFNKGYMLSLKTASGRKTISGNLFRIFDGDEVREKILTDDEIKSVLKDEFYIND